MEAGGPRRAEQEEWAAVIRLVGGVGALAAGLLLILGHLSNLAGPAVLAH